MAFGRHTLILMVYGTFGLVVPVLLLLSPTNRVTLRDHSTINQQYNFVIGEGGASFVADIKISDSSTLRNDESSIHGGRLLHGSNSSVLVRNQTKIQSVADLYEHLVCVTAISQNHYKEAKEMLSSVNRCLSDKKIIIYDLGLNDTSREEIRHDYTNVELRPFPFDDYSHLPHVRELFTYAWKPIITDLVSREYDVIMYGDASVRMISCDISAALKHLLAFPFFDTHPQFSHAIEFTHIKMIKYLHYPRFRRDMADSMVLEAGSWLLWANDEMKEKLIEPWLDCALHKECIAPPGARLRPCLFTTRHDGHYIACHRYDQSALNIILTREFGLDVGLKASNKSLSDTIWILRRT